MLINHDELTEFATRIFVSVNASEEAASETARHLVAANLKGHDSHGVGMIPAYVGNIRADILKVDAHASIKRDKGAVLLIDGGMGFGQVVGREAADIAIERVKDTGIVAAAVRDCHHLGRIGAYGEHCAAAGMVSVHFVNVCGHDPYVSPYGGRERRLATNPFCAVVPRPGLNPVVLDMATSAIAMGKVRVANNKGVSVPDGSLIDHEGRPTSDPSVMYNAPLGALGPFGAHKGYGLAVICELLGGGLAGEWTMQPENPRGTAIINHMLMIVIDPDALGGLAKFQSEVEAMVDYLHSAEPAVGVEKVLIPGEPETATREERLADGIVVDDNTWAGIVKAAQVAGLAEAQIPG
jgi:uncharacterized oxidoreductase